MAAKELDKRDWIAGLDKGLRIIEAFSESHPRLTPSTAARRTGITRTAARRYLLTLEHLGYVESDGTLYWLSPRILRLGWSYIDSARVPRVVQPFLQRLSTDLGGLSYYAVLDGDDVLYVARNGSNRAQSLGFVLGARVSAHVSSAGIAMLACRSDEEIDAWLAGRRFIAYTPHTLTDPQQLRAAMLQARELGYALIEQQFDHDRRGIAVALRDRGGKLLGALSVSLLMGSESAQHAVGRALPLLREVEQSLQAML